MHEHKGICAAGLRARGQGGARRTDADAAGKAVLMAILRSAMSMVPQVSGAAAQDGGAKMSDHREGLKKRLRN